jgi:cell division protein FtsI/penicillin-binding protein 2
LTPPTILEKGFPVDKSELFKFKGLILGSIEASFFTFDQLRLISDFVSQRGGGLLVLGGKNSFGQGISVTALQMVNAVAAIANDGVVLQPQVPALW